MLNLASCSPDPQLLKGVDKSTSRNCKHICNVRAYSILEYILGRTACNDFISGLTRDRLGTFIVELKKVAAETGLKIWS